MLRSKGSLCLVGRLASARKINKEAFKALLVRIWRLEGRVFFTEILDNLWPFEFTEVDDKRRVLEGRPWSYDRILLVLNDFDDKTPPSQMEFNHSPIWIQVHDMPLGCMNCGVGLKIGGSMGSAEEVDAAEDDVGWGRCLRIRVAIDLFKPLERGRALLLPGKSCWVSFKYEKLPNFCYKCGRILHELKGCTGKVLNQQNHTEGVPAWGSWLRAEETDGGWSW